MTGVSAPREQMTGTARSTSAIRSRLLAAIAASLCFSVTLLAVTVGLADLASQPARQALDSWESHGRIDSNGTWRAAYERLQLARRLNPLNADYHADLGRMLDWQAWQAAGDSARARSLRFAASSHYQDAIARRPTWGFAWAHAAESRALQGHRDHHYFTAFERAATLAPWEPGVRRKLIWMGSLTWNDLPESLRSHVLDSVQRLLERGEGTETELQLVIQNGWHEDVLPVLSPERQSKVLELVRSRLAGR